MFLGWITTGVTLAVFVTTFVLTTVEANWRVESTRHLRTIGLAMHNYHDTYKALPWNGVEYVKGEDQQIQRRSHLSWRVRLLPFLQEQKLYDEFDFSHPWGKGSNRTRRFRGSSDFDRMTRMNEIPVVLFIL